MPTSFLPLLAQSLPNPVDVARAVPADQGVGVWALGVAFLTALAVAVFLAKRMLEAPRQAELDRLLEATREARRELNSYRERVEYADRLLRDAEAYAHNLSLLLIQHGINVPPRPFAGGAPSFSTPSVGAANRAA